MTRILWIVCALIACSSLESTACAAPQDGNAPAMKRAGAESRQRNSAALPGARVNRPNGQAAQPAMPTGMRDPGQMVSMMLQKFDSDGDDLLNREELAAMFTFMQERRGQMAGNGDRIRQPGKMGPAANDEKDSEKVNEVGGVTPRRPPVE